VLASRRTNTLGLLLPEISGNFFSPLLRGIEAAAREAGLDLLIHATGEPRRNPGVRRALGGHNTDGLLVFTDSLPDEEILHMHAMGQPVVLMHQTLPDVDIPVVTVENKSGAFSIVSHLIRTHHKHSIAFLRGPERQEDSAWRERGYREALESHGLRAEPELIALGGFDQQIAAAAVQKWITAGVEFDSIFCGDDEAALGALSALQAAGRKVPEDVAIVGFDDLPFAPYLSPALTTVRAPIEQVGSQAVMQLVHLIRGEPAEPLTLLPTEVIIRSSCGCK
jgi:DNA-binding LacI/PurR family transcriptional regulator